MIQWITDFSHRVSQLQEVSRLVSQGGAKEIKVRSFSFRSRSLSSNNFNMYMHIFFFFSFLSTEFPRLARWFVKS